MRGAAIAAAFLCGYVLALVLLVREAARMEDLTVSLHSAPAAGSAVISGEVAPQRLRGRVKFDVDGHVLAAPPGAGPGFSIERPTLGPGMHFVRFGVRYGDLWTRDVGWAYLEGPFAAKPTATCGARMEMGQRLLDDGDPNRGGDAAAELQAVVLRLVNERLARQHLARARRVTVGLKIVQAGVLVRGTLDFGPQGSLELATALRLRPDGKALSPELVGGVQFSPDARFRVFMRSEAGRLGAKRLGLPDFLARGPVKRLIGYAYGAENAERYARDLVTRAIVDNALPVLREALRLPDAFYLDPHRSRSRVEVDYCGPITGKPGQSLSVGLAVAIETHPSRTVPGLAGPVRLGGGLPGAGRARRTDVTLTVSPDVLNAVLYAAWQTGQLRHWVSGTEPVRRFNRAFQHVPLRVREVDPALPPVVQPSAADPNRALDVRGDFRVLFARRRPDGPPEAGVVLVGVRISGTSTPGQKPALSLAPADLVIACAGRHPGRMEARRPCFTDAIGVARSWRGSSAEFMTEIRERLEGTLASLTQTARFSSRFRIRDLAVRIVPGTPPAIAVDTRLKLVSRR